MFRQVRLLAVVVLALAGAALSSSPAAAQQQDAAPPPSSAKKDGTHPDARLLNQSNARVVHAGPGAPMRGTVHVAPAQAKRDARK
jgi:hypothetical protein